MPPNDTTPPALDVTLTNRVRLSAVLRGLRVPFRCSESCVATAGLTLDRRVARKLKLKRALGQATSNGAATEGTMVVRVKRSDRRRLRNQRKLRLTLKVTATDAAGNAAASERRITARR